MPKSPAKKQKPTKDSPPVVVKETDTLESLAEKLGPPDMKIRDALFEEIDEATLVEKGTAVDSSKIIKDMPVFIGMAFNIERGLSDVQRPLLLLRPEMLPILAFEALQLKGLKAEHDAGVVEGAGGKAEREAKAKREIHEGIVLRDAIYDALRNALGVRGTVKLDEIYGTAETGEDLANGLKAVAGFIQERLQKGSEGEHLRLATFCIDDAKAKALQDKAASVIETSARTADTARKVTQRQLDQKDGQVVTLIEQVLRAYRAANRQDRSILVPELRILGRLFNKNAARKSKKTKPGKSGGGAQDGGG